MKLLFLDIDGVLNSYSYAKTLSRVMITDGMGDFPDIDPNTIKILNNIINESDCEIVLSTGWRYFPKIKEYLVDCGLSKMPIGETPVWHSRAQEINLYMKDKDVEAYAILDDNDWGLSMIHGNNFIHTDFNFGLTDKDADMVIKILNS